MADTVRVLSTLALKGAVQRLCGDFEAAGGARIDADFAPTLALLERLRARRTCRCRDPDPRGAGRGRARGARGRRELRGPGAFLGRHRREGRGGSSGYRDRARAARSAARRPFGGLFAARRQRHSVREADRAAWHCLRNQCEGGDHSAGLHRRAARDRRGRSRRSADQRTEAGRGDRGRRSNSIRTANACGVFCRTHGGVEQGRAGGPAIAVPRFAEVAPVLRESGLEP